MHSGSMFSLRTLGISAMALVFMGAAAHAQDLAFADIPTRTELHAFTSLTLPDTQFLAGNAEAPEVTLTAELALAQGTGRLPVVVLMHGSGGIGSNIPYWQRQLNSRGVATLTLDGLTGRGLDGVGDKQAKLGRLNFILDIYRALDILADHPRIDPTRVAIMGFSRGGQAALYSSLDRFQQMWNTSGVDFAAYVAFYPDCATTYLTDGEVADRPIRIFHGVPDDYNPLATCKAYVGRLQSSGVDVQLAEYPNAPHGFDAPLGASPAVQTRADQSVRDCTIHEDASHTLINAATQQPFSYEDACVRLQPSVGADHQAREEATIAVTDFLTTVLAAPQ